jgi:DNA polymerase
MAACEESNQNKNQSAANAASSEPVAVPWPPRWLADYEKAFPSIVPGAKHEEEQPGTEKPRATAADNEGGFSSAATTTEDGRGPAKPLPTSATNQEAGNCAIPVFIDLETRSACDLAKVGGRRYGVHPTTELITAVALIDNSLVAWTLFRDQPLPADQLWPAQFNACGFQRLPIETFAGPTLPAPILQALTNGRSFCAHNALGFDAHVWQGHGLPEPAIWLDTLPAARAAGLPGELDRLGKRLLGIGKEDGKNLIRRLCRPDARGQFPTFTLADAIDLVRYNIGDVLLLSHVYSQVGTGAEREVLAADQVINSRGVYFDQELARAVVSLDNKLVAEAGGTVERMTGGVIKAGDLGRTKFLLDWLKSKNVTLPNLQRATIENFLRGSLDRDVRAVLEGRLTFARVTSTKLEAALAAIDQNSRLRDQFAFHAAHTGRWSGRGVQLQNLPRPHQALKDLQPLIDAAHDYAQFRQVLPPKVSISAAVSALIRPCLRAPAGQVLCIGDFASIEARGVAWIAGEDQLLNLFTSGGDPYCDLASRLFGHLVTKAHERERQIGKRAILGCGYSMSARRFAEYAALDGINLTEAGVTAEDVVETYRESYPAIAGYRVQDGLRSWREGGVWRDVEAAAINAIQFGESGTQARCHFRREKDDLVVQLPSGREIRYCNARIEDRVPIFCLDLNRPERTKPTVVFDSPEHAGVPTYGGKLVENLVQAICRDLLAAAMVTCEREGLSVVLHCHDELVIEVPVRKAETALLRLLQIMSSPPGWAKGFPIAVAGFVSERYFKSAPPGACQATAQNGVIDP